jgi:DNA repair protein RadC
MDISRMTDRDLLAALIGPRATEKLYRGALTPLFTNSDTLSPHHRKLLAAKELVTRMVYEDLARGEVLQAPEMVKHYLITRLSGQEHESFLVLFLDSQNRLITVEELFRGTLTQTAVYPREILKRSLWHNAAAVIFAHNHPSGVAEPSRADEMLTQALRQSLGLIDVKVLDHFVVAGTEAVSMAERGTM